jgi:hypothetical protein
MISRLAHFSGNRESENPNAEIGLPSFTMTPSRPCGAQSRTGWKQVSSTKTSTWLAAYKWGFVHRKIMELDSRWDPLPWYYAGITSISCKSLPLGNRIVTAARYQNVCSRMGGTAPAAAPYCVFVGNPPVTVKLWYLTPYPGGSLSDVLRPFTMLSPCGWHGSTWQKQTHGVNRRPWVPSHCWTSVPS